MKIILLIILFFSPLIGYSQSDSIQLTLTDSIGGVFNIEKVDIDSVKWDKMGLDSLELYISDFNYSIVFKFKTANYSILIIERISSDEEYHWTCIVDNNEKLVDWVATAYDNSEGFMSIATKIKGERLYVREWNLYSDPEESIREYTITKKGFK